MMKHMPVLFVGHGSPMNAIENNRFSTYWETLGEQIPRPEAVLSISAHWYTPGLRVTDVPFPKMVYDMYGFPEELYRVAYNAPGAPRFAGLTKELVGENIQIDNSWGLDHGSWSVLCRMYPQADIPVFQMSVDRLASARDCYETGKKLRRLREQGVLILGSGNIVHNLSRVNWSMEEEGYPWALEFDEYIKNNILNKEYENIINYSGAGESAALAFQMMDHFAPLLYILGASEQQDKVSVFNDSCVLGSLSMTSYLFK
jgi:4,5-DOPA dioxygenase extradiol